MGNLTGQIFHSQFELSSLPPPEEACRTTLKHNAWGVRSFNEWAKLRNSKVASDDKIVKSLEEMDMAELSNWLSIFVCEVRKRDGKEYTANSLLSLVLAIQAHLRMVNNPKLDILNMQAFSGFKEVLDKEMERLETKGIVRERPATEVFTEEMEEIFWQKNLLGGHSPQILLRTILYLNSKNFGINNAETHRKLRYFPAQITCHTLANGNAYLRYTEDLPESSGSLYNYLPKTIIQHQNVELPKRCHVALFQKYMSLCPTEGRDDAFYLRPLVKTSPYLWFSDRVVGKETFIRIIGYLASDAGLKGVFTCRSFPPKHGKYSNL